MTLASNLSIVFLLLVMTFFIMYAPSLLINEQFLSSPSQVIMDAQKTQGILNASSTKAMRNTLNNLDATRDLDDSNDILKLKACFQLDQNVRKENMEAHVVVFDGMYNAMSQIHEKVILEITTFQQSLGMPLQGRIYLLFTQVPYFKNERNNSVHAGYYINDKFDYRPSNVRTDIYYRALLVFANYDKNKVYNKHSKFEQRVLPKLYTRASNDKQCFLRCMESTTMCGCASAGPGVYPDDKNYNIKCLGRNGTTELAPSTFYAFFEINRVHSAVHGLVSHHHQ